MAEFNETVLDHVSGDDWWGVSTGEERLRNKLLRFAEEYPGEVQVIAKNDDGSAYFHVPYKWVHIFRPRVLTESEKERRRQIARDMTEFRKNTYPQK